jgi:hypothetical protein
MNGACQSPQDLPARREQLRMRSEHLRQRLAAHAARLKPALRASDRIAAGLAWIKRHPTAAAAAVTALAAVAGARPRALLRLGTRAFAAWQAVRSARPVIGFLVRQWRNFHRPAE